MAEVRNGLGLTQEETDKELKLLENQYKMYEKTKKETERTMKAKLNEDGTRMYTKAKIDKQIELIQNAQDDTIEKYQMLGGNVDDLRRLSSRKQSAVNNIGMTSSIDLARKEDNNTTSTLDKVVKEASERENSLFSEHVVNSANDNGFDLIPLPSKGECYRNKMSKVPVAPLNANDENMIVAPNLYKDNLVLDYILNAKLLNKEIDPQDMLEGDREAILLYLRRDGYGDEYPIKATDNETGTEFKTVVDLSKINYKKFTLSADNNGWFPFTLPKSGHEIKFKFLTHRDMVTLEKAAEIEDKKLMKDKITDIVENLDNYIEQDEEVDKEKKTKIRQAIRTIDDWKEGMTDADILFNHNVTNRLELSIMSVDGNMDRTYIRNFIANMPARDSLALRNYIDDNEPGVDYTFTVEKPESLGGGSMEVFLRFDKFLFLNVTRV